MDRLDCRRSSLRRRLALFYGRLIAPRLAYSDPIVRAVATLGFALVILGFCELIWGEWPRALRLPTDTFGFRVLGVRVTYTRALSLSGCGSPSPAG